MVNLRILQNEDLFQAIRLSRAEGWNQTLKDWGLLTGTGGNVCLAALDGECIIGTATAMVYGNRVAWIGMVIVDREYRGRGIGKELFSTLLDNLHPDLSLKLDATPAGEPVYQKFGFKAEYLIYRMTCHSVPAKLLSDENDGSLEPVVPDQLDMLVDVDSQVFGADRQPLLSHLLENDPGNAWVIRQGEEITGLVLGRKGNRFYQIGPLVASSTLEAKMLMTKFLKGTEGQPVVVDIPKDKKELIQWLLTLGFSSQRHFVRMFQKENPYPGSPGRQFLIAGPEFG